MIDLAGSIRIFNKSKLGRIHDATVKVLEETGVIFKSEEALEIFKRHGAKVDGEVVKISSRMLENAVDQSPSNFIMDEEDRMLWINRGLLNIRELLGFLERF